MQKLQRYRISTRFLGLLFFVSATFWGSMPPHIPAQAREIPRWNPIVQPAGSPARSYQADDRFRTYLPLATFQDPWISPFGVQATSVFTAGALLTRTLDLHVGWARLGNISWRQLQPNEGDPIHWELLADFEQQMRLLKQVGITPEVVVLDSPRWATINTPFVTACGAIRSSKFGAFATFMRALVTRYSAPEFDVHNWELGNEVDVDPRLVQPDNGFGCWGNIDDPFYGGRSYGQMLKVVTPAIKAADPLAKVWIGGLLLASPHTTDRRFGRPELFLAGILEAGAAPYFDVVPYHWYPSYGQVKVDYDYGSGNEWDALGGGVVGKARYLRELMRQYGVDKPLFLNEISFTCPNDVWGSFPWCKSPDQQFFELQSNILVRAFARGMANGVTGFIWYTLDSPGWRHGALLDVDANPNLAYKAYQQLGVQLRSVTYEAPAVYAGGLEGYTFRRGMLQIQVIWAKQDQTLPINIPKSLFVGAFNRDGDPITPIDSGENYLLLVEFEPIYIVRYPENPTTKSK
jgi:hypothetical protein